MNVIAAAMSQIALRAKDATRHQVDTLHVRLKALDSAAKAAIALDAISDADVVEVGLANTRALDALDATSNVIMHRQLALMAKVPANRRSRQDLVPMSAPALLLACIHQGSNHVDHVIRNEGEGFEAVVNGERVGGVDAHSISVEGEELVIDGIGRWPLARIEAIADEEGLAFLLDDGTLIEIQQID